MGELRPRRRFQTGGLEESDPNFGAAMNTWLAQGYPEDMARAFASKSGANTIAPYNQMTAPGPALGSPIPPPPATPVPAAAPAADRGRWADSTPVAVPEPWKQNTPQSTPAVSTPAPAAVPASDGTDTTSSSNTNRSTDRTDRNNGLFGNVQSPWIRALLTGGLGGLMGGGGGAAGMLGAGTVAALLSLLMKKKEQAPGTTTMAHGGPLKENTSMKRFGMPRKRRFQEGGSAEFGPGSNPVGMTQAQLERMAQQASAAGRGPAGQLSAMQGLGINPFSGMSPGGQTPEQAQAFLNSGFFNPPPGGGPPIPGAMPNGGGISSMSGIGAGGPSNQQRALAGMPTPGMQAAQMGRMGPLPGGGMGAPGAAAGLQQAMGGMPGGGSPPPPMPMPNGAGPAMGGPGSAQLGSLGGPPPFMSPPSPGGAIGAGLPPMGGAGAPPAVPAAMPQVTQPSAAIGAALPSANLNMLRQGLGANRTFAKGGKVKLDPGQTMAKKRRPDRQWGDTDTDIENKVPATLREAKAKGGTIRRPKAAGPKVSIAIVNKKALPPPTPPLVDGDPDAPPPTPPGLKKGGKWIADAVKKPGALHKDLGVPKGEKIPAKKLAAAATKGGKVGKRARLAETFKKMRKAKGGKCEEPEKMAAGGIGKLRKDYPDTNEPKRLATGGKVRGCGAASKGCTFSGVY